jgi:signal transduction histidine kinase
VADISHDLRTPLTAIIGFAELMLRGKAGTLSEEHREYVNEILASSKRMLEVIDAAFDQPELSESD